MAKAIVTFKLMPESPEIDLAPIKEKALKIAEEKGSIGQMQAKEEPIAFGLKDNLRFKRTSNFTGPSLIFQSP